MNSWAGRRSREAARREEHEGGEVEDAGEVGQGGFDLS
jgi:hypothetical protein